LDKQVVQIKKILSRDRLNGYFRSVKKDKGNCSLSDALAYYVWNTMLSESFYSSLQTLEVSLRNSVQNAANMHFKNPVWFSDTSILLPMEIRIVDTAQQKLKAQGKNVDAGRIVAELNFGFWTLLFKKAYEHKLWHPIIKDAFPNMNPGIRTRKTLSKRLHKIRKFRNRIFHYEPIWYLNLQERHSEIIELISWIEPAMANLLKSVDNFTENYTQDKIQDLKIEIEKNFFEQL
jgi:hypothetical protein